MAFFTITALCAIGLFIGTYVLYILALFAIYRLTGGKRSFRSWFRAMDF